MLPTTHQIARMDWRELQRLAVSLRLSKRGETFLATSTRLYFDGMDEEAEIFLAIAERAEVLGRHGDDTLFSISARVEKRAK